MSAKKFSATSCGENPATQIGGQGLEGVQPAQKTLTVKNPGGLP
jgi:hypothetical protein